MNHTPGPWTHHRDGSVRVCDGQHGTELGCRTIGEAEILHVPRKEAVANARLIAAAPELLDALKGLHQITALVCDCGSESAVWQSDQLEAALRVAKAAIAKAEGDT